MSARFRNAAAWMVAWPLAIAMAGGVASAQTAALAPGQVSGPEIQRWMDQDGFAIAGVTPRGCFFMIRSRVDGRRQSVDCPDQGHPFTVLGQGQVVGHEFCSKFTYPDGRVSDQCYTMFKVGDNKYETRVGSTVHNVFYRLVR